ncbi:dnaJ homolog dnj-5 [Planococcus citri]|uniref:dnaJ homolog dnj-5 n=1 Tax=Planococcus citri TaxID=170843 RepID=UPI0031F7F00D
MEGDNPSEEVLSQKKSSLDDIIDHITADLQSYDGKYILLGQPSNSETQSIWQQRVTRQPENLNYVQNPYQEQQQSRINHLDSNLFYSSNSYVENSCNNYVPYVFPNSNQYQNTSNDSHYNYIYYQQNSNHSTDYGLFGSSNNYQNHHLIENLVGNWVPNQNGTYSPFGNTSLGIETRNDSNVGLQHQSPQSQHANTSNSNAFSKLGNSAVRRPRMVAEVRPMRPSYSDVLAKSVTQCTPNAVNGSTNKSAASSKVDSTRTKTAKNKKGNNVTKNGGPVLKRQHSSGSEEQMLNGVRQQVDKKVTSTNENHSWSSLEDLTKFPAYNDFEKENPSERSPLSNLNNKKGNRKVKPVRQNENSTETWNNKKVNENQNDSRKNVRKGIQINNNLQWGVGKQTPSPVRNDKKINKSTPNNEVKKANSSNKNINQAAECVGVSKTTASSKINTRFNEAPINQRKLQSRTKRREGTSKIALVWKRWREKTSQYLILFFTWFLNLLWDVLVMSFHLCFYLLGVIVSCSGAWFSTVKSLLKNLCTNPRNWWHQRKKNGKQSSSKKSYSNRSDNSHGNLTSNISLPQTGEEAMKRLFACKGKDPYSILGVTKNCPDEVIKKYYKRQAVLVHPDKNNQPGAEEAFKILVHAFELIGEPERRKAYDRCVMESVEEEWEELSNLISQLHKKMEYAANTIRCTNCGNRHKRSMVERPLYAARFCSQCKIHHSAREGDIWAESSMMGWLWRYYACMDGAVYDISDWAACQADNLRHLKPNTHVVQYRIVVGKHRPNPPPTSTPQPPPPPPNCSEQDLEDFLSSLYGHGNGGTANSDQCNNRFRKKSKRKK